MPSEQTVPLWEIWQGIVENNASYDDPYRAVELELEFTSPSGKKTEFWGYYDGENRWGMRFMPDETGTWRYSARFSDGSGNAGGAFACAASDCPGPVTRYADNKIWFGYRGGRPTLLRSIHLGDRFFAREFSPEKRAAVLDKLQALGYNMLSVASFLINRQTPGRGLGWDTPRLWPLDAAEFRRMEGMLDDLSARGVVVFPFAGLFGREGFNPTARRDQVLYVKYVMARLGVYWNLLWNVAGPEPLLDDNPYLPRCEIDRLGWLIRRYNRFGQLMTVHNQTGNDAFIGEGYADFGTLQGPKTVDRALMYRLLRKNHRPDGPLYAQETLWTHNICGHPDYTAEDVRKNACTLLMGAAMINYGDMLGDSSSGFSGVLEEELFHGEFHAILKTVWDFFESVPYYRLRPCPGAVDRGFCLGAAGESYLVYLEDGGETALRLDDADYRVERISPSRPEQRQDLGVYRGEARLSAPAGEDVFFYAYR